MKYVYGERTKILKEKFISFSATFALLVNSIGFAIPALSSGQAHAAPSLDPFPSTNDLNRTADNPHVNLVSRTASSVTLEFNNPHHSKTVWFEVRVDDAAQTKTAQHGICTTEAEPLDPACNSLRYLEHGEASWPSNQVAPNTTETLTYPANNNVSVRMTFGPERDWDFDWVAFYVTGNIISPTPVQIIEKFNPIPLKAFDYGAQNGGVQWAVKKGHGGCWGTTVAGNVDGFNTPHSWTNGIFAATVDSAPLTPGNYCFVFNPSQGERLTRNFIIAPDTTAPIITDVVLNDKNVSIARNQNCGPADFNLVSGKVNLSATITDDSGVKSAVYKIRKVTNGGCTQSVIYNSPNVTMSLSGGSWTTLPGTELDTVNVPADGTYTIQLTVTDNEDNAATHYIDLLVDNTAPTTPTITSPSTNTWHKTTPIVNGWTAASDENGISHYQIAYNYADGHTFSSSTCPGVTIPGATGFIGCRDVNGLSRNHTPTPHEQGKVTVWVRAIDKAGNVSPWSQPVSYNYDRTVPTTDISVSPVIDGIFTVSGDANDNLALNRVYVQLVNRETNLRCGGTTINLIPFGSSYSWAQTYDIATLMSVSANPVACPEGVYAAHVAVVDMAGNSSSAGWTDDFIVIAKVADPNLPSDDDNSDNNEQLSDNTDNNQNENQNSDETDDNIANAAGTGFFAANAAATPQVLGNNDETDDASNAADNQEDEEGRVAAATTETGNNNSSSSEKDENSPFLVLGWWWLLILAFILLFWFIVARRFASNQE